MCGVAGSSRCLSITQTSLTPHKLSGPLSQRPFQLPLEKRGNGALTTDASLCGQKYRVKLRHAPGRTATENGPQVATNSPILMGKQTAYVGDSTQHAACANARYVELQAYDILAGANGAAAASLILQAALRSSLAPSGRRGHGTACLAAAAVGEFGVFALHVPARRRAVAPGLQPVLVRDRFHGRLSCLFVARLPRHLVVYAAARRFNGRVGTLSTATARRGRLSCFRSEETCSGLT